MRKQFRNLILMIAVLVTTMLLPLAAFAATGNNLKVLKAGILDAAGKFKSVSSLTLYTNGDNNTAYLQSKELVVQAVTYDVQAQSGAGYIVSSKNRAVATVNKTENGIVITAGSKNGKTEVILADKTNPKKTCKIKVTVKSLVDEITFGSDVEDAKLNVAKKGSLSLAATVNANASNKKLYYTVENQKVYNEEGKLVPVTGKTKIATVNGSGVVKGVNNGVATIKVQAADQVKGKDKVGYTAYVKVVVSDATVKSVEVVSPKKNAKNKYDALNLVTNAAADNHTVSIKAIARDDKGVVIDGVKFKSEKTSVAVVDQTGKVTGVGNGTTNIVVSSKEGNKVTTVKIPVKVTTKLERILVNDYMEILTGKTVKLNAKVDKAVTDKKLVYEVVDGTDVISVSKSGAVKGLKPGNACVSISNTDGSVQTFVGISVRNAVKNLSLVPEKTELLLNDYETIHIECKATDANGAPVNTFYSVKSSNPSVLAVGSMGETVVAWAQGEGNATVTVKALDGSNKSASIKIKVVQKTEFIGIDGVGGNTIVLNANSDAVVNAKAYGPYNNKTKKNDYLSKVTMSYSFAPAKGTEVTFDPATRKFTSKASRPDSATEGVLTVTTSDGYVERYDVTVVQPSAEGTILSGLSLIRGEKVSVSAFVPLGLKVTYKSLNTSVATVDSKGMITAKKAGETTIQATSGDSIIKVPVRVVNKTRKEYEDSISKNIEYAVKAEDYSWTGVTPSYNVKNRELIIRINDAYMNTDNTKDIREDLRTVYENLVEILLKELPTDSELHFNNGVDFWEVYKEDGTYNLYRVGEEERTLELKDVVANKKEAAKILIGDKKEAIDWAGESFFVDIASWDRKDGYDEIEYNTYLSVIFDMDFSKYDSMIDERINVELAALDFDKAETGINAVNYNADTNEVVVDIFDEYAYIEDTDSIMRETITASLKTIFDEAYRANVRVDGVIEEGYTFNRNEQKDLDQAINDICDKIMNKLNEKNVKQLGALPGTTVDVEVGMYLDSQIPLEGVKDEDLIYFNYKFTFMQSAEARNAYYDTLLEDALNDVNYETEGFSYGIYDAQNKVLTVGISDMSKKAGELSGTGIIESIKSVIDKANAKQVVIDNLEAVTEIEAEKVSELTLAKALNVKLDDELGILVGKKAYVQVYLDTNKTKSIQYEIHFEVDTHAIDEEIDAQVEAFNLGETDYVDGITYDSAKNAMEITLNGKLAGNDVLSLKDTGIYEAMQAVIGATDTLKAKEVTFSSEGGIKTISGVPTKGQVGDYVDGYLGAEKIAQLAGQTIEITVVYTIGDKTVELKYSVLFLVSEANEEGAQNTETVEDAVADETAEEVSEEVSEEATEEVSEKVSEETSEETGDGEVTE